MIIIMAIIIMIIICVPQVEAAAPRGGAPADPQSNMP